MMIRTYFLNITRRESICVFLQATLSTAEQQRSIFHCIRNDTGTGICTYLVNPAQSKD